MPKLTISIASYNTCNYLEECLSSIYENTEDLDYEVIVVDNASSDTSVEMIKEKFTQVKLICNKVNRGFSGAHNQSMQTSRSEYFLVLNSDIKVLKGAFKALVNFMDIHRDAACASSLLLNPDGTIQENLGPFPSLKSELSYRVPIFSKFLKKRYDYQDIQEIEDFADPCAIIRRTAIDDVGGYDESFFLYMEETDWHYRMKLKGWKFYLVPLSKVIHYGGRSIPNDANKKYLLYQQNLYKFFKKHYGLIPLIILRIVVTLGSTITLIKLSIISLYSRQKYKMQMDLARKLIRISI